MTSIVSLNFNKDGANGGAKIQGWSYGVCIKDTAKLALVDATTAGTESAIVKNGAKADFDTITKYPAGVTHGVVIDFTAEVTIDSQNDWSDLAVTYTITMVEGESTYVYPCDKALGEPPVANVMVIGGGALNPRRSKAVRPTRPRGAAIQRPATRRARSSTSRFRVTSSFRAARTATGASTLPTALDPQLSLPGGPSLPCEKAGNVNGDCALDAHWTRSTLSTISSAMARRRLAARAARSSAGIAAPP